MKFDYQTEVLIDECSLDLEWKKQPALVLKYNAAKADAQRDLDSAKEALDLLIAQKDLEIRDSYEKKPTETQITNLITLEPDVQEAKTALNEAKYTFGLLNAACLAFDCRKGALENLVRLKLAGYFSEPTANIEERGALQNMRSEAAVSKVKTAMQRKK